MKSSIASRSMKLLSLAAKVGREELSQTIKDQFKKGVDEIASGRVKTRIEQARLIAENLAQLKGAAMKAGQLLSLDAGDYFPPEAVEILSKLQGKADPVAWETMRTVLEEDLGGKLEDFEQISETPAASASIGQVHRARLHGRDVAIKIQYPAVADSIESDLRILKTMAQSFVSLSGRKMDLGELFEELAIVLKQEADYDLELAHMQEFNENLEGHPDFIVPKPFPSHSSRRVLTMTWEEGLTVGDWLASSPSKSERERIASLALDLYRMEFAEWGLVQTDPNYGNFLITPDKLKLVLLDFGAVLRYTPAFREEYIELLRAMNTLDRSLIIRRFIEFGLLDPRESDQAKELFADLLSLSMEPFNPRLQPFRFRDDDYARRSREVGQKFTASLRYSPPPRRILFLHRKLGGVFSLLKKLDVQMDVTPYWEGIVGTKPR